MFRLKSEMPSWMVSEQVCGGGLSSAFGLSAADVAGAGGDLRR